MSRDNVVEFKNIYKRYQLGESSIQALNNLSLNIKKGSFTFIVGKSGSGKSTLLNLIGAIDTPTKGQIIINDIDMSTLDDNALADFRAKNIGHIFQNFNLMPVLNVYENIEYPLLMINEDKISIAKKVKRIIEDVGLLGFEDHLPSQLSGGQSQRVAIARALVKQPTLVLADEPTANLDSTTSQEIISLMLDMRNRYNTTFVFVTHDSEILINSDETFTLKDGKMEANNVK